MVRLAVLESFDLPVDTAAAAPSDDWLAGHRAGVDEGRAAALAQNHALKSDTAQALSDLVFSFREAQNHLLSRLAPLFRAISDQVVPEVLRQTLGLVLAEELQAAAEADCRAPLTLRVPPADLAPVAAVLEALPLGGLALRPDSRLSEGQILLDRGGTDTSFDFNRLSADIASALAALTDETVRSDLHG